MWRWFFVLFALPLYGVVVRYDQSERQQNNLKLLAEESLLWFTAKPLFPLTAYVGGGCQVKGPNFCPLFLAREKGGRAYALVKYRLLLGGRGQVDLAVTSRLRQPEVLGELFARAFVDLKFAGAEQVLVYVDRHNGLALGILEGMGFMAGSRVGAQVVLRRGV